MVNMRSKRCSSSPGIGTKKSHRNHGLARTKPNNTVNRLEHKKLYFNPVVPERSKEE